MVHRRSLLDLDYTSFREYLVQIAMAAIIDDLTIISNLQLSIHDFPLFNSRVPHLTVELSFREALFEFAKLWWSKLLVAFLLFKRLWHNHLFINDWCHWTFFFLLWVKDWDLLSCMGLWVFSVVDIGTDFMVFLLLHKYIVISFAAHLLIKLQAAGDYLVLCRDFR